MTSRSGSRCGFQRSFHLYLQMYRIACHDFEGVVFWEGHPVCWRSPGLLRRSYAQAEEIDSVANYANRGKRVHNEMKDAPFAWCSSSSIVQNVKTNWRPEAHSGLPWRVAH